MGCQESYRKDLMEDKPPTRFAITPAPSRVGILIYELELIYYSKLILY